MVERWVSSRQARMEQEQQGYEWKQRQSSVPSASVDRALKEFTMGI